MPGSRTRRPCRRGQLHLERIRQAQLLLEDTDTPLEHIAARVGMGTAATLRRHFTRTIGTTPSAYREAFRTPPAVASGQPA
ncbi:helix-turn-helix domain-containing protein [Amycolatopsis viridis]|uniref:Transcriptional regulator GlxA family with amidase domain n=1 Tax=Amycolatopsis viridis TaxID=185678 RepID=A0ABX0SVG5_9PSEU|nr:helix-turn-helix domain-containing protein [Amycolatopsis viridis]NIH80394.1 transcriptional regulator GlxA family with amidase domain [Amycolatopsis viridis]